MNAGSLGMDDAAYAAMMPELAKRMRDKTPMLVTLDSCPAPGSAGEAAVPVIRNLVGCEPSACADGLAETFDEDGKLRTRMTYVDGQLEGELLTFYPDGTVASRSLMTKGKFNGLSTYYYRDGKMRSTINQVNDAPDGEEREYHPDGRLAGVRVYSDHGVLRSERQYGTDGVLLAQMQWNRRQREQGMFRTWHGNGKPKQLVEYVDGVKEGWSRSWRDDGSVESACRFARGEGQGRCGK